MNLFNLEGKTALITGGIHGLGMAMAEGLAKAGAEFTKNVQQPLDVAIEYYRKSGFTATGYVFDVTDELDVKKKVAEIEANHDKIDICK